MGDVEKTDYYLLCFINKKKSLQDQKQPEFTLFTMLIFVMLNRKEDFKNEVFVGWWM